MAVTNPLSVEQQKSGLFATPDYSKFTSGNMSQDDNPLPSATQTQAEVNRADAATVDPTNGFVKPQPNILDSFASTSWSASVYLMPAREYSYLVTHAKKEVNGYFLLFQTAGAGPARGKTLSQAAPETVVTDANGNQRVEVSGVLQGDRNPFFTEDFYIDSLTVDTVLPGGGTGAAHSATNIKFTVVEPGNISLLDRLYLAVQDADQVSKEGIPLNYAAAQYLLVISWFGYDIAGNLIRGKNITGGDDLINPNAAIEKYIPFTINNIDFSVSGKLVTYDFDCSPVGQRVAGGTRRNTVPRDVQLTAGTVGQLLRGTVGPTTTSSTNPGTNTTQAQGVSAENARTENQTAPAANQNQAPGKANDAPDSKITLKQGLAGAMNTYAQDPVAKGIYTVADEYEIVFVGEGADEIANATLILPGSIVSQATTPMGTAASQNANQALNNAASNVDIKYKNWSITAGMSMIQAIDLAIRNSSFIFNQSLTVINQQGKEQINPAAAKAISDTKPMKWYKINFVAIPIAPDPGRNDWAYKLRFEISVFTLRRFDSRYFPLTPFRGVHKSYPYWFTGQNTAVLDYTAKFNNLYNLTVSGGPGQESNVAKTRRAQTANMRELMVINYFPTSAESNKGADNNANEVGANAAEYFYAEDSVGGTDLRIIGDPAWIQQGGLTGAIHNGKDFSTQPFLADGTINFDSSQVMFEVSWQRPEDYDLTTGLADPYARPGNKSRQPQQSNVYVATKVTSEFRGGRFEQVINGVLFNYPKPDGLNTVGGGSTVPATSASSAAAAGTVPLAASADGAIQREGSAAALPNVRISADNSLANIVSAAGGSGTLNNAFFQSAQQQLAGAGPKTANPLVTAQAISQPDTNAGPVNTTNIIAPVGYPRAPTGSGVTPVAFANGAAGTIVPDIVNTGPQKINDNPYATAARGQLISKDA